MMPDNIGYPGAAELYWAAGYRGILPLKHAHKGGEKSGLPAGYTGYGGADPSYADIMAWSEAFPDGNLCLRLPDGWIAIDFDAYGAKTGAAAKAEAIKRWGPLPPTARSSSRGGDLISGIMIFRVPLGTVLETRINFSELGIGDIEIIQNHHRYIVCWPSIHPEGRQYQWRDENDQIVAMPRLDEAPWLPETWIEGLRARPKSQFDGPIDFNVSEALTSGEPSPVVQERLRLAIKELQTPGASRHDTCTKHVMAIARLGKSGQAGVGNALRLLCDVLVAARQVDNSASPEESKREFIRMLTNDNLARELSKPGSTDWIWGLVSEEFVTPALPNAQVDPRQPPEDRSTPSGGEGVDHVAASANGASGNSTDQVTRPRTPLEDIEQGFWQSRESLAAIYQTALARMASPWAVLGICAARALTQVRPNVTLPPLIGGPGSLNWFCALVARSGGGKGAANAASNLLIPKHTFRQRTLGSGEGLVKLFDRPKNADADTDVNEAILVNVDEVDTLTALSQRTASTTIAVLKQGFSGESLGFSYINRAGVNDVQDHGYRMTLVVSVQPRKSAGLFADEGGGLPQRFMWFPAGDKRITMDERWPSTPLTLPQPSEWLYPREIILPPEAHYLIRLTRMKNAHEELDALDGHALFCREKFAYALTVLDGRTQMTLEDWELSGIAAAVSDFTRVGCLEELREGARLDAVERGDVRGIEMEAADVAKLQAQVTRGQKVLNWVLHKLDAAPEGWMTQGDLSRACAGRDGKVLSELLQNGHATLRGVLVNGAVRWSRA